MGKVVRVDLGDTVSYQAGVFACLTCGIAKKRARFKARPRLVKGVWVSLDLAVCDRCRKRHRASVSTGPPERSEEGRAERTPPPSRELRYQHDASTRSKFAESLVTPGAQARKSRNIGPVSTASKRLAQTPWSGLCNFSTLFDLPWEKGPGWIEVQSGLRKQSWESWRPRNW